MIRHEKRERAVNRHKLLQGWKRYLNDGVKQLDKVDYAILNIHQEKLYTHILVNLTRSATHKLDYLLE
ncbi:unnamed protein product [Rotaria magnacalcarata]|nr:unnamed protein product [Rotaria magnacalcarata]